MREPAVRRDTIAARRVAGTAGERRRRIVEAAVRAIEAHGAGAGLAAVADQAGLPRPHVYRHFTGKDDLDQAVARHAAALLSDWIRPTLTARGTAIEIIRGIIDRVLTWAVDHPDLYRFRARHGLPTAVAEFADALAAYLRAAGHEARPPAHLVAGLIGLVDGGIIWWLDHREESAVDDLSEWLSTQVWRVLADLLERFGRPLDPDTELAPAG
ncbi:TetR/AcrR family transcriptional regulator [Paractinoplanes rishiriensis]|uniref:TetR-family transcriptional regulator n=1 Tax=Paractinoplanes rishiriensis TaxID=1050105 RepID=A0A919JXF3_9ACTN|nr:TetR/AcrR family transcriptional regulator [Actinoplanes rishiriensis]GIE95267.1 putative TetR-family transcriptional regulator [Actinoplanes rishiriensis]